MAMAVDNRQQQPQYHNMGYEAMRYTQPQFTNPWPTAAPSQAQMYAAALPPASMPQLPTASGAYSAAQLPATSMASDGMNAPRPYGAAYAPAMPAIQASTAMYPAMVAASAPQYSADILQRTSPYGYDRRPSHPLQTATEAERQGFSDALDASRGMVAMSQSDITPRNIYGAQAASRTSSDSYGFPSGHSAHSSISSGSGYQQHYSSSVSEYSVGDYSSAGEDLGSRTLPRPSGLIGGALPPAPQSMMGQFSSKVSSSSQKKHKCKVCDKRFTRPSSLQTHMYSHTGEKPFACDVDGCGRHFSVVSNLRRHRKVHKGEGGLDHPSPDDEE